MKTSIGIDKAGRIVLPREARRQFHLLPGDRLDLEIRPDGILLRSRSRHTDLAEEDGLLVHEGEAVGGLAQAVALARTSRDAGL